MAYDLTTREQDVLELLLQGASTKEIAKSLGISPKTVEKHLTKIYRKYNVTSRIEILIKHHTAH